jgi:hypothetical protein
MTVEYKRLRALSAALLVAGLLPTLAQAAPDLSFSSYANVYGYLNTAYTSPLLGGDVNFSVNGKSAYLYNWKGSGSNTTGLASVDYTVEAGKGGIDPVYDIITNRGQYSFGYTGEAEVTGTSLHTSMSSTSQDHGVGGGDPGVAVSSAGNTSQYSYAQAQWNQQFYVAPTAKRAAGSYGAIVVGIKLDGDFPALADPSGGNNSWANLQASTSFTDTAGVSYNSSFDISTNNNDASWTGSRTVFKKLLFQYGTVFNVSLYQYAGAGNNGSSNFLHTGLISQIEVPFEATLMSGAEQAGLGDASALYGNVFNSATDDAQNTNWDFGNNGGGFTPNVPEPQTWALALVGLLVAGRKARRRQG